MLSVFGDTQPRVSPSSLHTERGNNGSLMKISRRNAGTQTPTLIAINFPFAVTRRKNELCLHIWLLHKSDLDFSFGNPSGKREKQQNKPNADKQKQWCRRSVTSPFNLMCFGFLSIKLFALSNLQSFLIQSFHGFLSYNLFFLKPLYFRSTSCTKQNCKNSLILIFSEYEWYLPVQICHHNAFVIMQLLCGCWGVHFLGNLRLVILMFPNRFHKHFYCSPSAIGLTEQIATPQTHSIGRAAVAVCFWSRFLNKQSNVLKAPHSVYIFQHTNGLLIDVSVY